MYRPKILFIAASCYPIDGAEANVNAKVLKALCDAGCEVDILSRKSLKSLCYPKSTDDYYFGKVRNIIEVEWYIKKDFKRIWNHLKVLIKTGYTYIWGDWAYPAIIESEKLIKKNNYDYIYSFNAPSEVVALYLHKKYGIKWVATWNDPYCWNKYPAPYGNGQDGKVSYFRRKLIRDIGKNVHMNIFPSERLRDYMMGYMSNFDKEKSAICPHLVMPEATYSDAYVLQGETLRILHAGALGKERNPLTFLKGLKLFLDINKEAKIELDLLGVFERTDGSEALDFIENNKLGNFIKFLKPVTYSESLSLISQFDACLLIEAPCQEGIFLPSKVADYMQLNKPIIAVSPALGTLNDMYQKGEIGYFADVRNPEDIATALCDLYSDFTSGCLKKTANEAKFYPSNYIEVQTKQIWK